MRRHLSIIFYTLLMPAFVFLAGCSDEDKDNSPTLSINPQIESLEFSFDGTKVYSGNTEVTPVFEVFTNQLSWDVVVSPAEATQWCSVEKNKDNAGFTISAVANHSTETPAPATLTISAGEAKPIVITVTQLVGPHLSVTPDIESLEFSFDGTKAYSGDTEVTPVFEVFTNQLSWDVVVTPAEAAQWCSVEKNTDNAGFTISAVPNHSTEILAPATLTISAGDAKPIVITVTQMVGPHLSVTPDIESLEFSFDGTKAYSEGEEIDPVFTVSTNQAAWDVVITPAEAKVWCSVEKNADNTGFTVSAVANKTSDNPIPAILTISAGEATPIVITVTQDILTFKVGDYWPDPDAVYKDGVLVSGTEAQGIVYWLDPEDIHYKDGSSREGIASGTKGKIISLDEGNWLWSSIDTPIVTGAKSVINGMENMATIQSLSNDFSDYPAFEWVDAKNAANTDYSTATVGVWYLPALNELLGLYEVWNGSSEEQEVNNMRTVFNDWLLSAGGSKITADSYWTSTDTSSAGTTARVVPFRNGGNTYAAIKYHYRQKIRAIRVF